MKKYAIVIHGGAVTMDPSELSAEEEAAQREGLAQALQAGWEVLHGCRCFRRGKSEICEHLRSCLS
ncbi:isoaspartyl peptidase/L-asparaginase [Hymenobacter psychrotolerans]|uniref:Asparaginase n=1 Tax=Hymenobacter psychrotolerans DSM 18569 TaxID=1121959 RepID=A0A1M7FAY4_9BACT|nr:isoaspartyl peptidase/L-asparaginase [Hymenobacter psychrotolerans]SHM01170.1 Asparaginase [Hymenobacter psychrotolerans DSM 18569]